MSGRELVILIRNEVDRFGHHDLFASELKDAFLERGWTVRILDYIAQPRAVYDAIRDDRTRFFLGFNGFGSELMLPTGVPGRLLPAFEVFNKTLFDLMHDCPAHGTMHHQLSANYKRRCVLSTDWDYAGIVADLGVRNIVHIPTITFPMSAAPAVRRDIEVLFAAGLAAPEIGSRRIDTTPLVGRIFQVIVDEIIERCLIDWSANPLWELRTAFHRLGISFSVSNADHRLILTAALDAVKFERRRQMLAALDGLEVTLVSDRDVPGLSKRIRVEPSRSSRDLLALMARCRVVLCPPTHMNGFHERPMSAFTAGAAVVSAPNGALAANFVHGEHLLFVRNADAIYDQVTAALQDEDMGERGHRRAMDKFHPRQLVEIVLSLWATSASD